jgi:hypothetical protein
MSAPSIRVLSCYLTMGGAMGHRACRWVSGRQQRPRSDDGDPSDSTTEQPTILHKYPSRPCARMRTSAALRYIGFMECCGSSGCVWELVLSGGARG